MSAALHDRNVRLLLLAQLFSLFGDAALWLAMGLWARSLTGSDAAAGMVFFALAAPAMVAPFGGLVVDRVRRRPVMIATDLASAGAVLLLLLVRGPDDLWIIYVVAVANGIGLVVFGAAQSALLASFVPGESLGQINGILQSLRQALKVISPLVGAGIFAILGGGVVAAIDAATFVSSAICLFAMRLQEHPGAHSGAGLVRDLTAGARHIIRSTALRRIVSAMAGGFLVIGFAETLIFAVVTKVLKQSLAFVGVMSAVQGTGAIIGGLTGAWFLARLGDGRLVATGLIMFGVAEGLLVVPSTLVALCAMALAGVGLAYLGVGFATGLQRRTPDRLQGRTYAASEVALTVPQTLSIGAGALLSIAIDFRILLATMTFGLVGSGAFLYAAAVAEAWPPRPWEVDEGEEDRERSGGTATDDGVQAHDEVGYRLQHDYSAGRDRTSDRTDKWRRGRIRGGPGPRMVPTSEVRNDLPRSPSPPQSDEVTMVLKPSRDQQDTSRYIDSRSSEMAPDLRLLAPGVGLEPTTYGSTV